MALGLGVQVPGKGLQACGLKAEKVSGFGALLQPEQLGLS